MVENWDRHQLNTCETLGSIKRNSFAFNYKRVEVWQGGACILYAT